MASTTTVVSLRLQELLKGHREAAGLSQDEAASLVHKVPRTVDRWERGETRPTLNDIHALANAYGLSQLDRSVLESLYPELQSRSLFEGAYIPEDTKFLVGAELASPHQQGVELSYVPGIAQRELYHREIQEPQLGAGLSEADAARFRGFRQERNRAILSAGSRLQFAMGLGALAYLERCPAAVKDDQVTWLRELNGRSAIEIKVIDRFHPAMLGTFKIVHAPPGGTRRTFVYVASLEGDLYPDKPADVDRYTTMFNDVWHAAVDLERYL